eukprot:scaffold287424_cov35-Attheya_sp.AAC.2
MHNQQLREMSEIDRMNHVDTALLNCRDDEERTVLWMTMVPLLVNYESVFCSICSCRLPQFYFTKSQHHMKRTRRACRHSNTSSPTAAGSAREGNACVVIARRCEDTGRCDT